MGAPQLRGWYWGRVVLANGNTVLLLLLLRHQPGLMYPFGRHILQLWHPSPDVVPILIIVLHECTELNGYMQPVVLCTQCQPTHCSVLAPQS